MRNKASANIKHFYHNEIVKILFPENIIDTETKLINSVEVLTSIELFPMKIVSINFILIEFFHSSQN